MTATPVRSRCTRPTWKMTAPELARVVAEHKGFTLNGNAVRDNRGRFLGWGWDTIAEQMTRRGWIATGHGVNWRRIDQDTRPLPTATRSAR